MYGLPDKSILLFQQRHRNKIKSTPCTIFQYNYGIYGEILLFRYLLTNKWQLCSFKLKLSSILQFQDVACYAFDDRTSKFYIQIRSVQNTGPSWFVTNQVYLTNPPEAWVAYCIQPRYSAQIINWFYSIYLSVLKHSLWAGGSYAIVAWAGCDDFIVIRMSHQQKTTKSTSTPCWEDKHLGSAGKILLEELS